MQPTIDDTTFGSITVDGQRYDHDIIITLNGEVKKRKKKLSKAIYGTSHVISLAEIEHVYEEGATGIVIGCGQHGAATLSDEAHEFLDRKDCRFKLKSTPEAVQIWNSVGEGWIGLFHITC